jgi:hypothetical protein
MLANNYITHILAGALIKRAQLAFNTPCALARVHFADGSLDDKSKYLQSFVDKI